MNDTEQLRAKLAAIRRVIDLTDAHLGIMWTSNARHALEVIEAELRSRDEAMEKLREYFDGIIQETKVHLVSEEISFIVIRNMAIEARALLAASGPKGTGRRVRQMDENDPIILSLRITIKEWRRGISETAFRRWNRLPSEVQRAANADLLEAIVNAFLSKPKASHPEPSGGKG
jgi:hypothetical protein